MFISYLKYRISFVIFFVFVSSVFFFVSYLSNLNFSASFYSVLICFTVYVLLGVFDFLKFINKMKTLNNKDDNLYFRNDLKLNTLEEKCFQLYKDEHLSLINISSQNIKNLDEIKDFYSMWVHQVKTPISAMNLSLQSDETEKTKVLKSELFKIERYTEMVTSYIRIESMSHDLLLKKYQLNEIISKLVKKYASIFIYKNISLDIHDLDYSIITDEKWLLIALEQILSNALKYTKQGGKIEMYSKNFTLYVKDNGIGISDEDLPRIFEKGFTGYNGRWDKNATGLGLYLSKKILDKLSNDISVMSKENLGTKVLIDLKREDVNFS